MKVVCVDSSNRPNDFPLSRWITKDEVYTAIGSFKYIPSKEFGGMYECFKTKGLQVQDSDLYHRMRC